MIVKKIILISFFLFGNLQILLSFFYKKVSIGFLWYSVNSNSLVGFQSLLEKYTYYFKIYSHFWSISSNRYCLLLLKITLSNYRELFDNFVWSSHKFVSPIWSKN